MGYYTDLHLHSRYAYATSRYAELENLSHWSQLKGIKLMATGDFTHPKWRGDLKGKLVPVEGDLFKLKPALAGDVKRLVPPSCRSEILFMLAVEVSTVYPQGDKYRRIHHLIFVPTLDAADEVTKRLEKYGDLAADGRPTLKLDSRSLLEIVLEVNPLNYLIPAHIWTPWFGVLGSKTGFDSIEEAYGDLAGHIFAVETGLSADPEMCRRVAELDLFNIVSFSDAHSPGKLGRELTELQGEMSFSSVRAALAGGSGYIGTVEFFPQEGKYYLDGHHKCDVKMTPEESKNNGLLCPVCKKKLTLGVLHRVQDLAARKPQKNSVLSDGKVTHMLSLHEVLAQILEVKIATKKVEKLYHKLLTEFGPEMLILQKLPLEDIEQFGVKLLAEAIRRLRKEEVFLTPGYDGVYGKVGLFGSVS